jgi:prefoldin subunit 5
MIDEEIAALRQEMRAEFAHVRARVDGLPLLGAAIETLRHDVRTLRAAINDMARVNITAGEVEALHDDIDRLQTKQLELETRIATLERRD